MCCSETKKFDRWKHVMFKDWNQCAFLACVPIEKYQKPRDMSVHNKTENFKNKKCVAFS